MANEENLIPFKKGQSGNPKGRKKGSKNRSTLAKKWLEVNQKAYNDITGLEELLTQEDLMTLAQIKKAKDGDVNAYKAIMDSAFGSPVQQIDQTIIEQPLFPDHDVTEYHSDKKDK
tara:strand:- start:128 stop:475 length:348 start_codon:yes stop_codon:yes gene_type:complete